MRRHTTPSPACNAGPLPRAGLRLRGFTLIEILVVLAICVGLVALMAGLYRAVGRSALALRSGGQEWAMQRHLRDQLSHLFVVPRIAGRSLEGGAAELTVYSWQSRSAGTSGMPVLAQYRYDESTRALYYQEQALPAWWPNADFDPSRLRYQAREVTPRKLLSGVEELSFRFLPADATEMHAGLWRNAWSQDGVPRLVELHFSRAGRGYTLWFETRSTDG